MKLEKEYNTYLKARSELLAAHDGKYVLIKETQVVDIFTSYEDALKAGLQKFGNVPFLVKQIQHEEDVNFFYTNVAA